MIGYHAVSVLADAAAHDVPDFPGRAWPQPIHSPGPPLRRPGLYLDHGYSPMNRPDSVSKTLRRYDDWCIARLAEAAGRDDLSTEFDARADGYRAHWDASITSCGLCWPTVPSGRT